MTQPARDFCWFVFFVLTAVRQLRLAFSARVPADNTAPYCECDDLCQNSDGASIFFCEMFKIFPAANANQLD